MAEKIKVLIPEKEVNARIEELGKKISEDYAGKQVHLICVLKGGVFFMCELIRMTMDTIIAINTIQIKANIILAIITSFL